MTAMTRAACAALDADDALAPFRDEFCLPDGVIYLDGNSLGPLPKETPARLARAVETEWGEGLIRSWNDAAWIDLPFSLGDRIGRLIGAPPGSVAVADSTSVNVFKQLSAALALRPGRHVILSEAGNFPTDLYMAQGLTVLLDRGHVLRLVAASELPDALGADVAVMMLTHVDYRTGAMHDMAALTRAAHAAGAVALWDLAHSAGAVPVDLLGADADLAVGCGYKFLNGGPGAPAFLYVAPRLQRDYCQPLTGWLGHAAPFAFEPGYRPADGIARAVTGTPSILAMRALEVGVDMMLRAPMAALRAKSLALAETFIALMAPLCAEYGFVPMTPAEPARRGSQVSFAHQGGFAIMQALIARGVIGDFRAPDILRFGLCPLYLRHVVLCDAVETLAAIMRSGEWEEERFGRRGKVT
jgi:kynureninase